jgi:hypothetical protein
MVESNVGQGGTTQERLSPAVRTIVAHLCQGDCQFTILCPGCSLQSLVDEDELAELRRWTDAEGHALV